MKTFQEILRTLTEFWEKQNCIIHQGYDLEVGAGTFNPATFLRCLGPEPYRAAYIEPSRRPSDGRYGDNPIRMQHYFQYQVILKPSPANILDLYLSSLEAIGFDLSKHDIRFVHDDWESPTLGAWGLGWEVWMDGMEVTQFTYFQSLGGQELKPITGEITYGIERLSTFLQGVDSTYKLQWSGDITYGDIYKRNEYEWSHYNFEESDANMWFRHFEDYEKEAKRLIQRKLPLPAYDFVAKASHAFNMLDARGAISVSERSGYIGRIRDLARQIAELYNESRQAQNYPLLNRFGGVAKVELPSIPAIPAKLMHSTAELAEDFLLEVGVEELPATFVPIGVRGLEEGVKNLLLSHKIPYKELHSYGTPRRLAVVIKGLSLQKPAQTIEKKGPHLTQAFDQTGQPLPAGLGFFRSLGISPASLQQIKEQQILGVEIRSIKNSEHLYALIKEAAVATATILQNELPKLILNIAFPKTMRWGSEEISFARPIRWLVTLFDEEILPFALGSVVSARSSFGHRQLSNFKFDITHPSHYLETLHAHHVLADIKEREASINLQLNALEQKMQGKTISREKVIAQVLHLVEWPTLTFAEFDKNYLKAPKEILVCEMVEHQKYFPVEDADGNLKNQFVITANNNPSDLIREGNKKVLSARLYDGTFLYEQDLKAPLETFSQKLKTVTYMQGLGSLFDKTERLKKHVKILLQHIPIASADQLERAAHLSKIDLVSGVVYEFPELQGTMGKVYALHHGESKEIATSIDEQWMPRGENAPLPETPMGIILSLADKLDNIISCFGLGFKPTSSSDPYALRRQVLGIIRILIQKQYHLPLHDLLNKCIAHFPTLPTKKEELIEEISQFFLNRIKTVFLDYGLSKDEIEASLSSGFDDIYDTFCRITALREFRKGSQQFSALCEVYKRAKGQIPSHDLPFASEHLQEQAEKSLHTILVQTEQEVNLFLQKQDYSQAYQQLSHLQPPLATLFDKVKILDDDPTLQKNRLALLQRVFGLFGKLVDFSKIQN